MWVLKVLCFLLTATCFVLIFFVARKMAQRIHNASKKHGLAFFRDPDARRISQILIVVVFIMGLGLEGMGVPLGSGVNSFSWWKYLLFIGLVATLVPDLRIDLKTVIGEITTSARDLIKPEKENVSAIPGTPGQHPNQPVPDPGMTNQQQAWTPEEVVNLDEFIDEAEEVDIANDIQPPMENVEIVAIGDENADDEYMVDLSNVTEKEEAEPSQESEEDSVDLDDFADMEVTEEAGQNQEDEEDSVDLSDFADMEVAEEAEPNQVDEEDAVDLSHFADMKVAEEAEPNQVDEEDAVDLSHFADMEVVEEAEPNQEDEEDSVDLSDFADMKVAETASMEDLAPAESEQVSSTPDATEQEHEGEDDMREFLKDFP